jgi:hypothetical protein
MQQRNKDINWIKLALGDTTRDVSSSLLSFSLTEQQENVITDNDI